MAVYVAYLGAVIAWGMLCLYGRRRSDAYGKAYASGIGLLLFSISAFRADTVGTDLPSYITKFEAIPRLGWADMSAIEQDRGFYLFIKLLSYIDLSPRFYVVVIAAIFAVSVSVFIYRYSREPILSFYALLPLGLFSFSMTGLRQALAISVLLFAYPHLVERKWVRFFLVVLLASAFHATAIVFAVAYFVAFRRVTYRIVLLGLVCVAGAYVYRYAFATFFVDHFGEQRGLSITEAGGGITTLLMYSGILVFGLLVGGRGWQCDHSTAVLYGILVVGVIFQMMTPLLNEFFRISMYFSLYNVLFIPAAVISIRGRFLRTLCYVTALVVLSILYFGFTYDNAGVYPYRGLWE